MKSKRYRMCQLGTKESGLKPFEQIGREMGLSGPTVNKIYQRAIHKMLATIRDDPELSEWLSRYFGCEEEELVA